MVLDERGEFADALALSTAGTGLALLGDVIDLTVARNVGNSGNGGKQLFLVIQVTTAPVTGGASFLGFELVSDAQPVILADGSASVHARTNLIAKAALVAGYTFIIAIPPEGSTPYERYLGILQNVTVSAASAGAINAFIVADVSQWKATPDGI